VLDLGIQPIANALLDSADQVATEEKFPLQTTFCSDCSLLQVTETIPGDVLYRQNYPYYSSFIPVVLKHAEEHANLLIDSCKLMDNVKDKLVVEVASNDGYLLQYFSKKGIPVLGIDPAVGPTEHANKIGVDTMCDYFSDELAKKLVKQGKSADVLLANNVIAHVDGINDIFAGFSTLLKPNGVGEVEIQYLADLVTTCAFDTIYHEHVFYHSITGLTPLLKRHGLHIYDALRMNIHGGSIRVTFSKQVLPKTKRLLEIEAEEASLGIGTLGFYTDFAGRVKNVKEQLVKLVKDLVSQGKSVAAYGAAAKGATLLNYVDLNHEYIKYVVDRNIHKVGKLMPGVGIPIRPVTDISDAATRPDYVLLLAWNFGADIMGVQHRDYLDSSGKFILPVPEPKVVDSANFEQVIKSLKLGASSKN
jgi:hypothetical protein